MLPCAADNDKTQIATMRLQSAGYKVLNIKYLTNFAIWILST